MLVSPKCPTLKEEDELRIVQFNSLDMRADCLMAEGVPGHQDKLLLVALHPGTEY